MPKTRFSRAPRHLVAAVLAAVVSGLAGCAQGPTAVSLQIEPPTQGQKLAAIAVAVIEQTRQNEAQAEAYSNYETLFPQPPYVVNIQADPERLEEALNAVLLVRVSAYIDDGRGFNPVRAHSQLIPISFTKGQITTRKVTLDSGQPCGRAESNSLGCVCRLIAGNIVINPDTDPQVDPCPYAIQDQTCRDVQVPGIAGASVGLCLEGQACPPGEPMCPCREVGPGIAACGPQLACEDGICVPCSGDHCPCRSDDTCDVGLFCRARQCCDPTARDCPCTSDDECEPIYGEGSTCFLKGGLGLGICGIGVNPCEADPPPPGCLAQTCFDHGDCPEGSGCFSGVCCDPSLEACRCASSVDCSYFGPDHICGPKGNCLSICDVDPVACEICSTGLDCGEGFVCSQGACCDPIQSTCPCAVDADCQNGVDFDGRCVEGTCLFNKTAPCPGGEGCPAGATTTAATGSAACPPPPRTRGASARAGTSPAPHRFSRRSSTRRPWAGAARARRGAGWA